MSTSGGGTTGHVQDTTEVKSSNGYLQSAVALSRKIRKEM